LVTRNVDVGVWATAVEFTMTSREHPRTRLRQMLTPLPREAEAKQCRTRLDEPGAK